MKEEEEEGGLENSKKLASCVTPNQRTGTSSICIHLTTTHSNDNSYNIPYTHASTIPTLS
jgi:hypothetical protein